MEPLVRNIFRKLRDLGLMTLSEVVDGSSVVIFGRQRNRFVYVKRMHGRSFFIKSAHETEPATAGAVAREAGLYRYFIESGRNAELRPHLLDMLHHDLETGSLILTYLDAAENLQKLLARRGPKDGALMSELGRVLALCHRNLAGDFSGHAIGFDRKPHWIFRLEETPGPLASLRGRGPACDAWVTMVLGRPDWLALLRRLRWGWQERCLIHGDFKFENVLVLSTDGGETLRLIDWERADLGDPAWDLGYGLAAPLILALGANPKLPLQPDDVFAAGAWVSASMLLESYRRSGGNSGDTGRLIDMICARLLVASYESCNGADVLPDQCLGLLALADHVIGKPPRALVKSLSVLPEQDAA